MAAFFDPHALSVWWQAVRSVTSPCALGVYAIEWEPTTERDDVLGRLGGIFHGTVMEYLAGRELSWPTPVDAARRRTDRADVARGELHDGRTRVPSTGAQSGFEDSPDGVDTMPSSRAAGSPPCLR
jgi:hypothetical protein